MNDLSERQLQILKAVIEEHISSASAVGSETLDKKYNLGISPATIRNEMMKLADLGYLRQSHTSAGRTPTAKALRLYIKDLMKSKDLSVADEVAAKEAVWDYRQDFDRLLREMTHALAKSAKTVAIATDEKGDLYYAGAANILEMPEFYDIDLTKNLFLLLDQFDFWEKLIKKTLDEENPIHLLLGEELGPKYLEPCGFIYAHYQMPSHRGVLGLVGPCRLDYPQVIPTLQYYTNLLEEIGGSW